MQLDEDDGAISPSWRARSLGLQADLVEELAAASVPAFQEEEADALSSMPEEQLMNQQPVFHELRSAPVLSDADTVIGISSAGRSNVSAARNVTAAIDGNAGRVRS